MVSDRLHYTGHVCSSVWDPSAYPSDDTHSTSVAESLNRLWQSSAHHCRIPSADNLIAFLCARTALHNLRSMHREVTAKSDLDEEDLTELAKSRLKCSCHSCRNSEQEQDMYEYNADGN